MLLKDMIDRLLGRPEKNARGVARDRLKLVLMQDRSALPASTMELIRKEILQVLSKYVEIDEDTLDVSVERADDAIILATNMSIRNVRKDAPHPAP